MIQELQEIVYMLIVEIMPEIVDLIEAAPLGDEASDLIRLIKCVKMVHRVFVTGKRSVSRIQAKKRSGQGGDGEQQQT